MVKQNYELMFIISPELNEEEIESLLQRVQGYLEEGEALVFDFKSWGIRRLAYTIKKKKEGRYYLSHFEMDSVKVNDFKRRLLLTEGVLRELITKAHGEFTPEVKEEAAPPQAESEKESEITETPTPTEDVSENVAETPTPETTTPETTTPETDTETE